MATTTKKAQRFTRNSKRSSGSTSQSRKAASRTQMSSTSMLKPFVPSIKRG